MHIYSLKTRYHSTVLGHVFRDGIIFRIKSPQLCYKESPWCSALITVRIGDIKRQWSELGLP